MTPACGQLASQEELTTFLNFSGPLRRTHRGTALGTTQDTHSTLFSQIVLNLRSHNWHPTHPLWPLSESQTSSGCGGHRQSSSTAPGPPLTGELYVQDKENARVCHRLWRPRSTSSFSLRPCSSPPPLSLSSKPTTSPCQQPALVTCPTTSSTPILSISLLVLQ